MQAKVDISDLRQNVDNYCQRNNLSYENLFMIIDKNRNGVLSFREFNEMLYEIKLRCSVDEAQEFFHFFDTSNFLLIKL